MGPGPEHGDGVLAPGTMVGEYVLGDLIGTGAFGEVYAGEHPLIGKKVAVKVLGRRFASDPEMVSRFIAEARAVNRIRQRNIIDIFAFGVLEGGRHYFVMERCEGRTLGALIQEKGRLPVESVIAILQGVAAALDAVHEAGITHRDLKPDNVFLTTERDGSWFPKLLDFGVAKLMGDESAARTSAGAVLGTPRYMSPEQARGKATDPRSDIYALGVMTHEMLTGSPPFAGDAPVDVLMKHASERPPPMSSVCPDLPAALDAPVLAMLAKRPKDRPASAGKAVAALVEQAGKPRPEGRGRRGPVAAAVLVVIAFAVTIGMLARSQRPSPPPVVPTVSATPVLPASSSLDLSTCPVAAPAVTATATATASASVRRRPAQPAGKRAAGDDPLEKVLGGRD